MRCSETGQQEIAAKLRKMKYKQGLMFDKNMPDVALEADEKFPPLDWVGMKEIEVPVVLTTKGAEKWIAPARVEAKVSLDKKASRGIHMSRLYVSVQEKLTHHILNSQLLQEIAQSFLQTHQDLSSQALVAVSYEHPLTRPALKSAHHAWRTYPVTLSCVATGGSYKNYLEVLVTYSSTCPASAALSRQLIQEQFKKTFSAQALSFETVHAWLGSTEGIVATPHAQRSFARVKVQIQGDFSIVDLIDAVEEALQTPVQGAVKREDEQEFALRNGQNLMFCEDAGRRVKKALDHCPQVMDYVAELNHVESLHPHNAVSRVSKGLELKTF